MAGDHVDATAAVAAAILAAAEAAAAATLFDAVLLLLFFFLIRDFPPPATVKKESTERRLREPRSNIGGWELGLPHLPIELTQSSLLLLLQQPSLPQKPFIVPTTERLL